MNKKHNVFQNEKILIDVVKNRFSSSEMLILEQCINEIEKNKSNRHIILTDDTTGRNEKIVISIENGTLSVKELKKLAQCIRDIEQNKPSRHINILMKVPDKTVEEMQEVNESITPGFPIKRVIKFNKADRNESNKDRNEFNKADKNESNKDRNEFNTADKK